MSDIIEGQNEEGRRKKFTPSPTESSTVVKAKQALADALGHPAEEQFDLEIATNKELDEAKKEAGVSSEKESLLRNLRLALDSSDMGLLYKATERLKNLREKGEYIDLIPVSVVHGGKANEVSGLDDSHPAYQDYGPTAHMTGAEKRHFIGQHSEGVDKTTRDFKFKNWEPTEEDKYEAGVEKSPGQALERRLIIDAARAEKFEEIHKKVIDTILDKEILNNALLLASTREQGPNLDFMKAIVKRLDGLEKSSKKDKKKK